MNILFCQHNSICEPGVVRAFKGLGHKITFTSASYSHPEYDEIYSQLLSEYITTWNYQIVFSINFIPVISKVCEKHQIPYFCWIVDSPVIQLYSNVIYNSCNYIFCFDYTQYAEFVSKNPGHIFYLPLGCDLELYDSIIVTPEDHARYDCDISFVGSLYTEKCRYNSIAPMLPEFLQGYFEGVLNAQRLIYGYNFLYDILTPELVQTLTQLIHIEPSPEYEIDIKTLIGNILLNPKCTEMERIHLLNAIAERFSVDFYTESDTSKLKNVNCKGVVSSMDGMPKVFKCSKINLNPTAKGIQSGASLRIFDILGCGGFLLSNYQAELPNLFEANKEIVLFESEADMLDKIAYFLQHENERKEIAHNGYLRVQKEYSYKARLALMLDVYETL